MNLRKPLAWLGGIVVLGLAAAVWAEAPASDVSAELKTLRAEVAELRAQQSGQWLNERRAEEIKTLVREVLSDADTRASLAEGGMVAGHNGKNFFLASEKGDFLLTIAGQIQARYVFNNRDAADGAGGANNSQDDQELGFTLRRVRLFFEGFVSSPKIGYKIHLDANRDNGSFALLEAQVSYQFADGWTIQAGRYKAPFLREEITSTSRSLAVEPSVVNSIFTAGYCEGVMVTGTGDWWKVRGMFNDGFRSGTIGGTNDFENDAANYGLTGRLDVKLAGDWKQLDDYNSWTGDPTSILLGAAIHFEEAETGGGAADGIADNILAWTVDGGYKAGGLSLYGAMVGLHTAGQTTGNDMDSYGFIVQAAYMVVPDQFEPFARFEWIREDTEVNSEDNDLRIITAGFNYYLAKHAAKFTMDVVWCLDPVIAANTLGGASSSTGRGLAGLGLLQDATDKNDQIVIRAQFQLLF